MTIGGGPSPRSGCVLLAGISRLLLYGGYSLEKDRRDFSRGVTQTDMFALVPGGLFTFLLMRVISLVIVFLASPYM